MTDQIIAMVAGVAPFGVLALASLSKPFRLVLKSVFTDGNSSSVIKRLPNGDVELSSRTAWRERGDMKRAELIAARRIAMASRVDLWEKTKSQLSDASYKDLLVALNAAARDEDKQVIITIQGEHLEAGLQKQPSRAGKHKTGGLVTESPE